MFRAKLIMVVLAVAVSQVATTLTAQDEPPGETTTRAPIFSPAQLQFFEREVKPILAARCFKCHGGEEKIRGGLRLTYRDGLLKGGDSGPAVDLERPDESLLLAAINFQSLEMPPSGRLPENELAILTRWVEQGLPYSSGVKPPDEPDEAGGPPRVNDATRNFWSHRPLERPAVPKVERTAWVTNPIDAFVLARLERAGLSPAAPANRHVLVRRVYYDLIGLPPTPAEVRAFVSDESPDAYERLIERLLDSPHYGEKWGRHWLDLVRYAETDSYERDAAKPHVWRYRDWVIRSLNDDKPYDEFIREQLAGDELEQATRDTLIATGYYRLGIWDDEPADPLLALYDELDDIQKVTAQVFLGMTIDCARCHDHKLDPIPQADYYRMLAFFSGLTRYGIRSAESVAERSLRSIATPQQLAARARAIAQHRRRMEETSQKLKTLEDQIRGRLTADQQQAFRDEKRRVEIAKTLRPDRLSRETFDEYAALRKQWNELQKFRPPQGDMALCVTEIDPQPRSMHVLIRGNPHAPGDKVTPGFPSIFGAAEPEIPERDGDADTSGRRTALANWIADEDNPRTARVMVNRLWQYHFGRGIVRSANDFGLQGTPPTHPLLLDWLASEFIERGWRLKTMHKLIVQSSAYRMSSTADPRALAEDPENDLFWRFNMRRLTAEEIRDSVLAVNGSLNRQMFGPSIYPVIPQAVLAGQSRPGQGWGESSESDRNRRSIYIHIKRSLQVPVLENFDAADTDDTCPVRFSTTQPTQALGLLNGDFLNREAEVFAALLQKRAKNDPREQVRLALWRTLQRQPTRKEIDRGVTFLDEAKNQHAASDQQALKSFCLLALNLNEFLYVD